jgi:hypothetical protein
VTVGLNNEESRGAHEKREILRCLAQVLEAQTVQANAMAVLAAAVRQGQADQREVLIAMGVIGRRIEEQRAYLIAMDQKLPETGRQ